jgi:hypothetical protein
MSTVIEIGTTVFSEYFFGFEGCVTVCVHLYHDNC